MNLKLPKPRKMISNASVIKRFIAFLIDLLIVNLIIIYPFKKQFDSIIPQNSSLIATYNYLLNNEAAIYSLYTLSIIISIITLAYFIILEYNIGQSIGKKLLGLKVVSTDNSHITFWQHFLRNLFIIPLFPFVLLIIIDPINLLFSSEKQRLTESFSKTKVVEEVVIGYEQ